MKCALNDETSSKAPWYVPIICLQMGMLTFVAAMEWLPFEHKHMHFLLARLHDEYCLCQGFPQSGFDQECFKISRKFLLFVPSYSFCGVLCCEVMGEPP